MVALTPAAVAAARAVRTLAIAVERARARRPGACRSPAPLAPPLGVAPGVALHQPDGTTCGSCSLVMARMLVDPAFAGRIAPGPGDARTAQRRFADQARGMQARTSRARDRAGRRQLPYPAFLGTAPWAVANEMSAVGGSGVPGTRYGVHTVSPRDRDASYRRLSAAVRAGHPVPLYVGNRVAPGHVVLVTGADGDGLRVYDPTRGRTRTITRAQFVGAALPFGDPAPPLDRAGAMTEPWFAVVPRGLSTSCCPA